MRYVRSIWRQFNQKIEFLKLETYAIYLASHHPRVPWYAKALAAGVVAYAFSPIDLIPDFIPIFGYVDDLILLPLGIWLVLRMIPQDVIDECRDRAAKELNRDRPTNWIVVVSIVAIWIALTVLGGLWLYQQFKR